MGSPYRTTALEPVSRQSTAWGTGERFTLRVPMPEAEVLAALGLLVQATRPSRSDAKSGNHRPFFGQVVGRRFDLVPLRPSRGLLHVRVNLEPAEDFTIVDVEVALRLGCVVPTALLGLALLVWIIVRGYEVYYLVRGLAGVVLLVATAAKAVSVGISAVRLQIVEGMLEPTGPRERAELEAADDEYPRLFEHPERAIERFDAWLRERLR